MKSAMVCTMVMAANALAACSDALVFGDRSSIEVASVRLNDDVAEPIRVNIGLDRQLVTNAPALGGTVEWTDEKNRKRRAARGEAINLFSTFRAEVAPETLGGEQRNLLKVHTRFASGAAAREIAGKPDVVARILGLQEVQPPTVELAALQTALSECLGSAQAAGDGGARIDGMATALGLVPASPGVVGDMRERIVKIDGRPAYDQLAARMRPFCPEMQLP